MQIVCFVYATTTANSSECQKLFFYDDFFFAFAIVNDVTNKEFYPPKVGTATGIKSLSFCQFISLKKNIVKFFTINFWLSLLLLVLFAKFGHKKKNNFETGICALLKCANLYFILWFSTTRFSPANWTKMFEQYGICWCCCYYYCGCCCCFAIPFTLYNLFKSILKVDNNSPQRWYRVCESVCVCLWLIVWQHCNSIVVHKIEIYLEIKPKHKTKRDLFLLFLDLVKIENRHHRRQRASETTHRVSIGAVANKLNSNMRFSI